MIRQANLKDADKVADLILHASSVLFKDILKTEDLQKQKSLLLEYIKTPGTKFSYDNILVYEIENEVAAALVLYDVEKEAQYNQTMEMIVNNGYKFELEGEPETIYLDSLAVDPKYRGEGLSRKLFEYAIENSEKDLSLLVETYKKDVEEYYKRLGFKVLRRIPIFDGAECDVMLYQK